MSSGQLELVQLIGETRSQRGKQLPLFYPTTSISRVVTQTVNHPTTSRPLNIKLSLSLTFLRQFVCRNVWCVGMF